MVIRREPKWAILKNPDAPQKSGTSAQRMNFKPPVGQNPGPGSVLLEGRPNTVPIFLMMG